jgi:hypothetical protein
MLRSIFTLTQEAIASELQRERNGKLIVVIAQSQCIASVPPCQCDPKMEEVGFVHCKRSLTITQESHTLVSAAMHFEGLDN